MKSIRELIHYLIVVLVILPIFGPIVSAQTLPASELNSIYNDTVWYKPGDSSTSGTAGDCSTQLVGSQNEDKIWNYLISKGLSPNAVAGLMGNFEAESNFITTATNPKSGAYGIAQWLGTRLTGLTDFASSQGQPKSDLALQLDFMWQELSGSYKSTVTDVINAPGVTYQTATQVAYNAYEGLQGSGQGSVDQRTGFARDILAKYGSDNSGAYASVGCQGGGPVGVPTNCQANGIVYQPEYSLSEFTKIFGPPARTNNGADIVTMAFFGTSVQVNKIVAPCLKAVEQDLIKQGVTYRPEADKGGIGCLRETDGQVGDKSYHVYGAACDINSLTNNYFKPPVDLPYDPNCPIASGSIGLGSCYDMPDSYIKTFARYGFFWGGNFNSLKDYMHFEWHGVTP